MALLYKLTDVKGYSGPLDDRLLWGENVTHSVELLLRKPRLCTRGVIHAYPSVEYAIFFNRFNGNVVPFKLWEAEGDVIVSDRIKAGCYELTTIKNIPIPDWYNKFDDVCWEICLRLDLMKYLDIWSDIQYNVLVTLATMINNPPYRIANEVIQAAILKVSESG